MALVQATSRIEILGIPVSSVDAPGAVDTIARWITHRRQGSGAAPSARYVCACDVHNVMRAQSDAVHMRALRHADMIVPDGAPLVWVSRLRGRRDIRRVAGADLMTAICDRSVSEGWSHYFYGGAPGVADKLAGRLAERHQDLNVAGTECPPFRPMSADEIDRDIARINSSGADIVWIGLGCPKQEIWMFEHRAKLQGRVVIGVGAAFDFHSGRIERAPSWMRDRGLEWLHRLVSEPRRLWRRYLVLAPKFVVLSLAETVGVMSRRALEQLTARG